MPETPVAFQKHRRVQPIDLDRSAATSAGCQSIYPSISADDCTRLSRKPKVKGRRIFSASAKAAVQSSRSIPSRECARRCVCSSPSATAVFRLI